MKTLFPPPNAKDVGDSETDDFLDDDAFDGFAERLACGENDAATELLNRFSTRLVSLACAKLSPRLATKSDPEDVVQSVMRTFFRRLKTREVELRDWPSLWGLLSLLTIRKCAIRGRAFGTAQRNVNREISLTGVERPDLSIPGREPTPLEVATFVDLLEKLLASASTHDREIIEGLISGQSVAMLADQHPCSERTIYRAIERLRRTLKKMTCDSDFR